MMGVHIGAKSTPGDDGERFLCGKPYGSRFPNYSSSAVLICEAAPAAETQLKAQSTRYNGTMEVCVTGNAYVSRSAGL